MLRIHRGPWGILLLVALLASPAMTAEAGPSRSKSGSSIRSTAKRSATRHKHRRARRAPAGGVYARSAIILDPTSGQVLFEKNSDRSVPIASLTKLMTMMVFLEQKPDLSRIVDVTKTELDGAGHTQLRRNEQVSLQDLVHMSLMCSDNVATRVLARESGLDHDEFIARMNKKAAELGLADSRFVEFTGLDEHNVASAADVARLLRAAADNDLIRGISTTRSYEFWSDTRRHQISNTNRLLYSRYQIVGGKTGFINEAGYCLATWVRTQGRDLIAVVLGAPTNATRFADVVRMVQRTMSVSLAPTEP